MQEVSLLNSDGDEAATTAEPPRRYSRQRPALERGLPIFHPTFGSGKIVAIQANRIIAKFGKNERVTCEQELVTRVEAEVNWHSYWLRGEKRRLKEGKLLWIVKSLCRYREWQGFLDRYDYPRSTADDLIRRYKEITTQEAKTSELHGNRASDGNDSDRHAHERTDDPDADELEELVAGETEKRRGRKPTSHPSLWSIRIKLPSDVMTLCRKQYKKSGSKEYWRRAAYWFVELDPDDSDHNSHSRDDESESSE